MIIELILTITAWRKGWGPLALLPLAAGLTIGVLGAMASNSLVPAVIADLMIYAALITMIVTGRKKVQVAQGAPAGAALMLMAIALGASGAHAHAQTVDDLKNAVPPEPASATADADEDATAKPGAVIYLTDSDGQLATITLGTYSVHIIGKEGVVLTDIGFNPVDHNLYGVSFTDFYRVDTKTGKATRIGSLGINDANALVFNGQGVAYTEGPNSTELYTIDTKTGHVKGVGSSKPYKSDGDLTFYNGGLMLAGYDASSLGSETPTTLVLINPKNGEVLDHYATKIVNLYGLVCTGKDLLYGFAGTSVYQFFPTQSDESKRAVLLKDLKTKGLGKIYGAAYNGYFLY